MKNQGIKLLSLFTALLLLSSALIPAGTADEALPSEDVTEALQNDPAGEEAETDQQESGGECPNPAEEEQRPAEEQVPAHEGQKPMPEEQEPAEEQIPAREEQKTAEEEQEPAVKEEPVEETVPAEEEQPTEEEPKTTEEEQEPEGKEEPEAAGENEQQDENQEKGQPEDSAEHFDRGYISLSKTARIHSDESLTVLLGTFAEDVVVYAENVRETDDPAKDILKIVFDTEALRKAGDPLQTAYVPASEAAVLSQKEVRELEQSLLRDPEVRRYGEQMIPISKFTAVRTGNNDGRLAANSSLAAEATPASRKMSIGSKGTFTAKATDAEGTVYYRWQYSQDSGKTWQNVSPSYYEGYNQKNLTVTASEKRYSMLFRCRIVADNGIVFTNPVRIRQYSVTTDVKTRKVGIGETARFTAEVTNAVGEVEYRWQYSADDGKTWLNASSAYSGYNKATIRIVAKDFRYGFLYRCRVTADNGTVFSRSVWLDTPYEISVSPRSKKINAGTVVKFRVTTKGATGKLKYRWQYSTDYGTTWNNTASSYTGYNRDTLSVVANSTRYGLLYRCMVTADNGKAPSGTVYIAPANVSDFAYQDNGNDQWVIVGYKGTAREVRIPAGHMGKATVAIGANAFRGSDITSVVIPGQVTAIDTKAFAGCSLEEITIPSAVTDIAEDAFDDCVLKNVHAEESSYAYRWMRDKGYIREYRALLIGQKTFLRKSGEDGYGIETIRRNAGDVNNLTAALEKVKGPRGAYGPKGDAFQVTRKTDLSYSNVESAIKSAFADTLDQDISIFFIATHGLSKGDGDLEMAFTGDYEDESARQAFRQYLPFSVLAGWLNAYVKGKVIIIIESCGAGSAIYQAENGKTKRSGTGSADETSYDPDAFVSKAVKIFSERDRSVTDSPEEAGKGLRSNTTGDLRVPRFYVLAAAAHHEDSWGLENRGYNFFTKWLIEGIGSRNNSPADTDGNNALSLYELFSYIQKVGDTYISSEYGETDQHVQCYPMNNRETLLRLR